MSNWFPAGTPKSKELKEFRYCKCDDGTEKLQSLIQSYIKRLQKIKCYERTKDFRKHGLYPGQQVFYENVIPSIRKYSIHPVLYLGDGFILELGSCPQDCFKRIKSHNSYFGINTLKHFKKFGRKSRDSETFRVITPNDSNPEHMIRRLERAKKRVGFNRFGVLTSNCRHITNYCTFGVHRMTYPLTTRFEPF